MRDGRQALLEDICLGVLDYAERLRKAGARLERTATVPTAAV